MTVIFYIYYFQILSLQLSAVVLRLPLLMGLCMRGIMRHLVQPHIMWLTQKGGQLVMLDILVGPRMLNIQVLRHHNSQILWTQSCSKQLDSLLHHYDTMA